MHFQVLWLTNVIQNIVFVKLCLWLISHFANCFIQDVYLVFPPITETFLSKNGWMAVKLNKAYLKISMAYTECIKKV